MLNLIIAFVAIANCMAISFAAIYYAGGAFETPKKKALGDPFKTSQSLSNQDLYRSHRKKAKGLV
jgi:hypothetical protein